MLLTRGYAPTSGQDHFYKVAIGLRARYAMSGTDIAYGATSSTLKRQRGPRLLLPTTLLSVLSLRAGYAMSGTDIPLHPHPVRHCSN
eukprot:3771256-Rhodomonas_salina.1